MINSRRYNPDGYEAKRLEAEIKNYQESIEDIQEAIAATKEKLYEYINNKERIYQDIRKGRKEGYKEEDSEMLLKDIAVYEKVVQNGEQT